MSSGGRRQLRCRTRMSRGGGLSKTWANSSGFFLKDAHSPSPARKQRWLMVCACWKGEERGCFHLCMRTSLFHVCKQGRIIHALLTPLELQNIKLNYYCKGNEMSRQGHYIALHINFSVHIFNTILPAFFFNKESEISCPSLSLHLEMLTNMMNS